MAHTAVIISDGKPGHENQSRALCEALQLPAQILRVGYPPGGKALSCLLDRFGLYCSGLYRSEDSLSSLRSGEVQLVVGTGSTAYYPAKCVARRFGCPSAAVLMPRGYRLNFAAIVAPEYDRPPERDNIVPVPVNLCSLDAGRYQREAAAFAARHRVQRPAAGFIIGGDNAVSCLDPADLDRQIREAMALLPGHEFWVTTSRRTPAAVDDIIEKLPFDYRLVYRRDPDYNPTPAFVALCERLFVTSDSASMISEGVCFGSAAVEVLLTRQKQADNKFLRLIRGLETRDALHVFDGNLGCARSKIDLRAELEEVKRLCRVGSGSPL